MEAGADGPDTVIVVAAHVVLKELDCGATSGAERRKHFRGVWACEKVPERTEVG